MQIEHTGKRGERASSTGRSCRAIIQCPVIPLAFAVVVSGVFSSAIRSPVSARGPGLSARRRLAGMSPREITAGLITVITNYATDVPLFTRARRPRLAFNRPPCVFTRRFVSASGAIERRIVARD